MVVTFVEHGQPWIHRMSCFNTGAKSIADDVRSDKGIPLAVLGSGWVRIAHRNRELK
jgi:hypothetical protein